MSAQPAPGPQSKPRISNVRTAKHATQRRITRKARARYSALIAFCIGLVLALIFVMLYVMLTARLTSLNYAVGEARIERAALRAQTAHLEDRLAALRSDDRLAAIAAKLHMHAPTQFAVVTLPPSARLDDTSHIAFLTGLAGLFHAR